MSPEQAEGRAADARSDISSFGTVLYEMLPDAPSPEVRLPRPSAHRSQDPEHLNAPPALEAIVRRCLSKSRTTCFQTATDLRRALEGASAQGISGIKWRTIALATVFSLLVVGAAALGIYLKPSKTGQIDSIAVLTA